MWISFALQILLWLITRWLAGKDNAGPRPTWNPSRDQPNGWMPPKQSWLKRIFKRKR